MRHRALCHPRALVVAALLALALSAAAQVEQSGQAAPSPGTLRTAAPPQEMGTGESLSYLGRKLWFEMRRRLNLTSAQEEQEERAREERVRLKVGGIRLDTGGATAGPATR